MSLSFTQGPSGLEFETQSVTVTCNDAVLKGNIVTFVLASGGFAACAKSATADSTPDKILGVALEDISAGAQGRVGMRGVFTVLCHADLDDGEVAINGGTAGQLTAMGTNPAADASAYVKPVGIALETIGAGGAGSVLFDGITGFAATDTPA
jgi:predicted RecA/RadA family phage recombinase